LSVHTEMLYLPNIHDYVYDFGFFMGLKYDIDIKIIYQKAENESNIFALHGFLGRLHLNVFTDVFGFFIHTLCLFIKKNRKVIQISCRSL